jgi:hypothetical protein
MNLLTKLFHRRPRPLGTFVGRRRTTDSNAGPVTSIKYRMGAGFAGDVNRTHPASIEPCLIDPTTPPTFFGEPVVVDATSQGVRALKATDTALDAVYGIAVRPYPFQQSTATAGAPATLGAATPPTTQPIDVLRSGYIMVPVVGAAVKGGRVFVWIAAASGAHVQGGFEIAASGSNTIALDEKSYFNGSPDANGLVELGYNL